MSAFTEGYYTASTYDNYFIGDINPNFLRMVMLLNGYELPKNDSKDSLTYLELGFGQGLGININSASTQGDFWGTDFNAQHVESAKKCANSANIKSHLLQDSFNDLAQKSKNGELPLFDVIALHGIWSWINDENRQFILDIVKNNLKEGGICFVSYNCLPGWANFAPVRELLKYHADHNISGASYEKAVNDAFTFITAFEKTGAKFFSHNPKAIEKIKTLDGKSLRYIIHEFLNDNWDAFYFKDVAALFQDANCSYITTTDMFSQMEIALPKDLVPHMRTITDPIFKETLRDFALNRQFRKDIFIKGAGKTLNNEKITENLDDTLVVLRLQAESLSLSFNIGGMKVEGKEDLYKPILNALAENNYEPKLVKNLRPEGMSQTQFYEVIKILFSASYIHPAQKPTKSIQTACEKMNAYLCKISEEQSYSSYLASPILGNGVVCSQMEQIMLNAMKQKGDVGKYLYDAHIKMGQLLQQDGVNLDEKASITRFTELFEKFKVLRIPYLTAVGIITK